MKATCDECGMETKVKFEEIQRPKGVKITYFNCGTCYVRYIAFVTDAKVRKLQKEIRRSTDKEERIEKQAEVDNRMGKLKRKEVD